MIDNLEKFISTLNGIERTYFYTLRDIVKEVKPKKILEVGSGWGISAVAFLLENEAGLTTVDKIPFESLNLFQERIKLFNLSNRIRHFTGDSKEILPTIRESFDIVYVDGDHTYEGALSDLHFVKDKLNKGGILLMDDVFHKLNWTGEFGVVRALGEFILATEFTVKIYGKAHGFARIDI